MAQVTKHQSQHSAPARRCRKAMPSPSPRLIEEAVHVFLALGITATDLRLRARPGSPLRELADAMESSAGAR